MRSTLLFLTAFVVSVAQAAVISAPQERDHILVSRDACGNGVKIRGSGSVNCSNGTCTACSGGKCCTVKSPQNNSCNSATPYLNLDTCTFEGSTTTTKAATTTTTRAVTLTTTTRAVTTTTRTTTTAPSSTPSPARNSFADRLKYLFGNKNRG